MKNYEILKFNSLDSTNDFLKNNPENQTFNDQTIVWTLEQTKGRGQQNAKWETEPYKNLTFSLLKYFENLPAKDHFLLNMVVSLSILKVLKEIQLTEIALKWPNDILVSGKKVCGILIENTLYQNRIKSSIIGIGLNVNQQDFGALPKATSLKNLTGRYYDLQELLVKISEEIFSHLQALSLKKEEDILSLYHQNLFRKDKPSTFKSPQGDIFMGFIRGVSGQGELILELEDQIIQHFRLKEIEILY